ncbi:MAG: hypothetical protein Q4F84_07095 [Fibrobacter sp.]|nr:hypothetical protein [Fibrobacter sp.]
MHTLNQMLENIGNHTTTIVKSNGTGAAVFTEFGARLLGLFPSKNEPNVLWTSDNLEREILDRSWHIGGERLWIAPQRNFYFKSTHNFGDFYVSKQIDPGEYKHVQELKFENSFTLQDHHYNQTYESSTARREFSLIDDPYESGLEYIGFKITEHLSILSNSIEICPWSITQVFTKGKDEPGTAFFPIKPNAKLLSYFNTIPNNRASVEPGYARFLIDSNETYKLAIRPEDVILENPAKVVYLSPVYNGPKWLCLVKRSNDMPTDQQGCVDPSQSNPDGLKGAIQAYNNAFPKSPANFYGEIELQLTKGICSSDRTSCDSSHELLSYIGTKEQMLELAKNILGIDTFPKIY